MLNSSNLCVFEGRMIEDPKMSQVSWNGKNGTQTVSKAEFKVAIDRKMTKEQKQAAQNAGKPTADFPRFVVMGPKADFVQKWLGKGKPCRVVGSFETQTWMKDGVKQYGWNFTVEDISFTVSDNTAGAGANAGGNTNNNAGGSNSHDTIVQIDDSDMPF